MSALYPVHLSACGQVCMFQLETRARNCLGSEPQTLHICENARARKNQACQGRGAQWCTVVYIFLIFFAISVDHRASPCSWLASFLDVSRGRDSRSDGSDVLALDAGGAVCGDPQRTTRPRVIVSASCASCTRRRPRGCASSLIGARARNWHTRACELDVASAHWPARGNPAPFDCARA